MILSPTPIPINELLLASVRGVFGEGSSAVLTGVGSQTEDRQGLLRGADGGLGGF